EEGKAAGKPSSPGAPGVENARAPNLPEEERTDKDETVSSEPAETDQPSDRPLPAPAAPPSIRKMARELGLDLGRVRGSERGGRIVLADLRAYIQRLQKLAFEPKAAAKPQAAPAEKIDFGKWGPINHKPLSQLRKVIGRHMLENWSTI